MQNQFRANTFARQYLRPKALTALLGLLLLLTSSLQAQETGLTNGPPGKMIAIGTHHLHLYCQGEKSPTILIDSGMGNLSLEWQNLQQQLSVHSRVCVYDRAGYGWSEMGRFPRTSEQIANELYHLIRASQLPGPFILVGHSFGGYNMRLFASQNPELVAGLVLVDSSHPDQFSRMQLDPRAEIAGLVDKTGNRLRYTVSRPVLPNNYPQGIKHLAYSLLSSTKSNLTRLNEQYHFEQSARQVREAAAIPNVPLVVLSHGKHIWPQNQNGHQMESIWSELQQELSYLTTVSLQIIAKSSGHAIHLDQPELVTSAILNVISVSDRVTSNHIIQHTDFQPAATTQPEINVKTAQIFNFAMTQYAVDAIPVVFHNDIHYALRIH